MKKCREKRRRAHARASRRSLVKVLIASAALMAPTSRKLAIIADTVLSVCARGTAHADRARPCKARAPHVPFVLMASAAPSGVAAPVVAVLETMVICASEMPSGASARAMSQRTAWDSAAVSAVAGVDSVTAAASGASDLLSALGSPSPRP